MRETAERHPNLITWLVLALGMLVVLAWSAREVVLSTTQWFWLGVATVLLAGLCAWIISWEADEPEDDMAQTAAEPTTAASDDDPASNGNEASDDDPASGDDVASDDDAASSADPADA